MKSNRKEARFEEGGPAFAPSIVQFHCFAAEVVVRLKISGREVDGMSWYLIGAPTSFHGSPRPPRYSDAVIRTITVPVEVRCVNLRELRKDSSRGQLLKV